MFDVFNNESFENLNIWYSDVYNYCMNQGTRFAIILVGIKNIYKQNSNKYTANIPVNLNSIKKFVEEKDFIIDYCEVNISDNFDEISNLKEPFEILLHHFSNISQTRPVSTNPFSKESLDSIEKLQNNHKNKKSIKIEKECCAII